MSKTTITHACGHTVDHLPTAGYGTLLYHAAQKCPRCMAEDIARRVKCATCGECYDNTVDGQACDHCGARLRR